MVGRSRFLRGALAIPLAAVLVGGLAATITATTMTPSATAQPTGWQALAADLDRILADARLRGAHAGVVVRDADTGEALYERGAVDRLLPASNNKLLTSAAALQALGSDYRFTTAVHAVAEQRGAVLEGDLYLRGTGDPTLLAGDYERLAAGVAAAGIRVVTGRLMADDTWFDKVRLGSSWAWDDEPFYYSAQVSALSVAPDTDYDAGTVILRIGPGAAVGDPATVQVVPATDYLRIDNRATTGAAGTPTTVAVDRPHGSNTIVVTGSMPAGRAPAQYWRTVWEPTGYAADVFGRALAAHGVRVIGGPGLGATPTGARVIADHRSMTLAELLLPFMKLSNNGHAEVLTKAMGRELRGAGTWSAGLAVLGEQLATLGVPVGSYRMVDGSGLSRMQMLTADLLSDLLVAAQGEPWFDAWYASLPIAGEPDRMVGGTLRSRMVGTAAAGNAHAKTGSLTGVTALSGYVTAASGEPLVFSILLNNYLSASPKDIEDAIVVRLAEYAGELDQRRPQVATPPGPRLPADDPATVVDESSLECTWARAC